MELEPYEHFYYAYQTQGRGLTSSIDLIAAFEGMARTNDEIFGPLLPKHGRALDVACGYGSMLFYFKRRGLAATGFDLDQNQVALARSIGLEARCGDLATELKGLESSMDVVSAMDVIEHLRKSDAIELLRGIHLTLSSNGILVLRCPCADGFTGAHDVFNDMTHRWGATSVVVRQILLAIGFKRVELMDISVPRFPMSLRSKLKVRMRKVARRVAGLLLKTMGVPTPRIWSNSLVAVAWK